MSAEKLHKIIDDTLLIIGFGSFGIFQAVSELSKWCKEILPITGVLSFVIYVLINWSKIKEFFKS